MIPFDDPDAALGHRMEEGVRATDNLTSLLVRVKEATGADRELEFDLCRALGLAPKPKRGETWEAGDRDTDEHWVYYPEADRYSPPPVYKDLATLNVTSSLDAALALCERVLPEQEFSLTKKRSGWAVMTWDPDDRRSGRIFKAKTPSLALLAALLRAKIAEETTP